MDSEGRVAIILAGDEGQELRSLTRKIAGLAVPKQFCRIFGESTILEQTFQRVALAFPAERILTVVTRAHERFYERLLPDVLPPRLVVQPRDRGTAPAMLYALLRSQRIAANTAVAIFPSHHYVEDDAAFMRHVDLAFEGIRARPDLLVLLGTTPDGPEVDYCWIEMGERIADYLRLFQIRGFWERPPRKVARRLWQLGCLWNSSVLVAQLPVLLLLMRKVFPQLSASFDNLQSPIGTGDECEVADAIYETLSDQDFSHEVSVCCPSNLAVLPIAGVDWCDLGRPRRVMAALRRAGIRPKWLRDTSRQRYQK